MTCQVVCLFREAPTNVLNTLSPESGCWLSSTRNDALAARPVAKTLDWGSEADANDSESVHWSGEEEEEEEEEEGERRPSEFAPAAKTMNLGAWRQLASPSNIENPSSSNCKQVREEEERRRREEGRQGGCAKGAPSQAGEMPWRKCSSLASECGPTAYGNAHVVTTQNSAGSWRLPGQGAVGETGLPITSHLHLHRRRRQLLPGERACGGRKRRRRRRRTRNNGGHCALMWSAPICRETRIRACDTHPNASSSQTLSAGSVKVRCCCWRSWQPANPEPTNRAPPGKKRQHACDAIGHAAGTTNGPLRDPKSTGWHPQKIAHDERLSCITGPQASTTKRLHESKRKGQGEERGACERLGVAHVAT
ncbi:unnamed protein product [Prorocentrum cordatum]|uniref:Uncharacterized protein n=1 Tax=Prorocentrum cordatum TaxID=2364126 RepID=A0ABN9QS45_9DINO|nr:unnamed protein product [Polarella glacialis]